jgi:DNA-binding PucR family transcriptional regulator
LREILAGHPDLWRSLVALIEPLDRHDRTHHTEFLRTLEAFFESDLSSGAAAERLGIHRHTVTYRLKQIEHLVGCPVRSGEHRLAVELAIRVRRFRL